MDISEVKNNSTVLNVSLYQDNLLTGTSDGANLHNYNLNGKYLSSIQVPHILGCAKWTQQGNILYVSLDNLRWFCMFSITEWKNFKTT